MTSQLLPLMKVVIKHLIKLCTVMLRPKITSEFVTTSKIALYALTFSQHSYYLGMTLADLQAYSLYKGPEALIV